MSKNDRKQKSSKKEVKKEPKEPKKPKEPKAPKEKKEKVHRERKPRDPNKPKTALIKKSHIKSFLKHQNIVRDNYRFGFSADILDAVAQFTNLFIKYATKQAHKQATQSKASSRTLTRARVERGSTWVDVGEVQSRFSHASD